MCHKCLESVGMAAVVSFVPEDLEVDKLMRAVEQADEIITQERLTRLARLTAYAEELVDDDYLWFDSSAKYCREKIRTMLRLLGTGKEKPASGGGS
jgi:hypothetical protein